MRTCTSCGEHYSDEYAGAQDGCCEDCSPLPDDDTESEDS